MTQDIMLNFAIYFVKCLSSTQGELGETVILFLDGYSSWWDDRSLLYFFEHSVYLFFLASCTSIWDQPNDSGPNKRMHTCVETTVTKFGLWYTGKKTKVSYFSVVTQNTWKEFWKIERQELLLCGCNNITSAYRHFSLYPFNLSRDGWNNVLSTLGVLNKKLKKIKVRSME